MIEPTKSAPRRSRLRRRPTPRRTRPSSHSAARPSAAPSFRPGNAVAQTGGAGIGFGLSTGGGGTGGEINLGDFCCPDYLETMLQIIQRNWNSKQQVSGVAAVRFTVQRDGSITDVQLATQSGYAVLDLTAQRAILTSRLPPLPRAYTNNQLTITLSFRYQR